MWCVEVCVGFVVCGGVCVVCVGCVVCVVCGGARRV